MITVSRSGNNYWGSPKCPKAIGAEAFTHDVGSQCLKSHHTWTYKGQSRLAHKSLRSWCSWVEGACGPDTEQDAVGFLDTKGVLCSYYLITGNRLHSTSRTFPEFQWAGSNSLNREKRGWEMREGLSKETIVQPWTNVLVPPQGIHTTIFEQFCRYWNLHQVGEINSMVPTSP